MKTEKRSPWFWVPSLYFAEGIPYIIVMMVSVIMYKRLGVSNTDIALYTSWLYLPWVIKPLWSPLVDILRTKRFWIVFMQLIIGAGLAGVAFTIPLPGFFKMSLAFLWLLAFSSATHDIAADGFYMLGLSQHDQAWYVGIRSTFYRFAMITGQGLLIILAGFLETSTGLPEVKVDVNVVTEQNVQPVLTPDSLKIEALDGELRIVSYPEAIEVTAKQLSTSDSDSIMQWASNWNIKNGFTFPEEEKISVEAKDESVWQKLVVHPLENFLRSHFRQTKAETTGNFTGNIAPVYFHLSARPQDDEEVVFNFGRSSGDKSITLVEGSRLVFTKENWNIPAIALIQLDKKLKKETDATFSGQSGNIPLAWSITFFFLTAMFVAFFIYHKFILPFPESDVSKPVKSFKQFISEFFEVFVLFFKKERIGFILAFLLLYRLAEAQLAKLATPFLLDAQEVGGLALTTGDVGLIYGTVGLLFLTIGGLIGGFLAARHGLKYWIWFMIFAINIPDVVYVYMAYAMPDNLWVINLCVAFEQFGYGFGFTAYMLFMIYVSEGEHKTAHFAITTGFMALGMMIPGMISGWLQEIVGYQNFFIWVMIATIPGFLIIPFIPLDKNFGKKSE